MSAYLGSWRVAVRIARRSARRTAARTALVLAMLFLPAFSASVLLVSWANLSGTSAQETDFRLGHADMLVSGADPARLAAALPPGSRSLPIVTGETIARTAAGPAVFEYESTDVADPLAAGKYVVRAGRPARTPGEIALTRSLAARLGAGIGDRVTAGLPRRDLTVVGFVDVSRSLALPAFVGIADAPLSPGGSPGLLVDLPAGTTHWLPGIDGVSTMEREGPDPREVALTAAGATLAGTFAGAQIVLLVAATFLIGARTQRRRLDQLAATGATARQLRRVVLAAGLVPGVPAALGGVALGLLAFTLAGPLIERVADHPLIDVSVPFGRLALVAAGTVAIALLAAVLPARLPTGQGEPLRGRWGLRGRLRRSLAPPLRLGSE